MFWWGRDKSIEQYRDQLSRLSLEIHKTDERLKYMHGLHGFRVILNRHVLGVLVALAAYCYKYGVGYNYMGVLVGVLVLVQLCWYKIVKMYSEHLLRKLNQLQDLHERTVEQLKTDTNFQETSALLQRFQQGDDALLVIDNEIKAREEQLSQLKQEIAQCATKEEKDQWFDKLIGVMAGGNDLLIKCKCTECGSFKGLYRYVNEPIQYQCFQCHAIVDERKQLAQAHTQTGSKDK